MESMGIRDMNNLAFFKGKKVFLTGHTGFKGSWLSRILILAGAEVTGYALEAPKEAKLFDTLQLENNMHSVIGDIRDREKLISTMQGHSRRSFFIWRHSQSCGNRIKIRWERMRRM